LFDSNRRVLMDGHGNGGWAVSSILFVMNAL
jgi:hypothetical protein